MRGSEWARLGQAIPGRTRKGRMVLAVMVREAAHGAGPIAETGGEIHNGAAPQAQPGAGMVLNIRVMRSSERRRDIGRATCGMVPANTARRLGLG